MSAEFKLKGSEQLLRTLDAIGPGMRRVAGTSLEAEARVELEEARQRTPVDTGRLRDSGYVKDAIVDSQGVAVTLGFGGPDVPYAVRVHETLKPHAVGYPKFLESTVLESARYLTTRVANGIRKALASVVR